MLLEQLDRESLRIACAALRSALRQRVPADPETMRAPHYALTGLEHAALNAPQNHGWLRKRKTELSTALKALSSPEDLQCLLNDINTILQREPRARGVLSAKYAFRPAKR